LGLAQFKSTLLGNYTGLLVEMLSAENGMQLQDWFDALLHGLP
jgi:hypothetical protein